MPFGGAIRMTARSWAESELMISAGCFYLSASVTVIFCAQGNFVAAAATAGRPATINNFKSHYRSGGGGTNTIFADSHAGWVPYMQIGLP